MAQKILRKVLKILQNMTPEEYEKLYRDTMKKFPRDIKEAVRTVRPKRAVQQRKHTIMLVAAKVVMWRADTGIIVVM